MNQHEIEALVVVRVISAPPQSVYKAWTEPELMRQWLAPEPNVVISVDNQLKAGGKLHIIMQSPDGDQHIIRGEYQALIPHRYIAKTWCYSGPVAIIRDIETLLEVTLTAVDDVKTELTLTQRRLKTKSACDAYQADWPSCLDKLQNIFLH